MNAEAIARMENFAKELLKLPQERWPEFFTALVTDGLITQDAVQGLEEYVLLYRMLTDASYYRAVRHTVAEMLYHTFNLK